MSKKLSWDERYRRGEHAGDSPAAFIVRSIEKIQPGRALDLACGVGRHTLFLAERGWRVTAVDASRVAIEVVQKGARARRLDVDARVADLQKHEFEIQPESFDLVCDCYYLQRDLFAAIRGGVRPGGMAVSVIHILDDSADVKPMNPDFLLRRGELRRFFAGWDILHEFEGKPCDEPQRAVAEIVARRPID